MKKIIADKSEIKKSFHNKKDATGIFKKISENYKVEIIKESDQIDEFQIYTNLDTDFRSLQRSSSSKFESNRVFKLTKVSGAY